MNFRKLYLPLLLLVLASGCGQKTNHPYPNTLQDAKVWEVKEPESAFQEYQAIKADKQQHDPGYAAKALLAAAEYGADETQCGTAAQAHVVGESTSDSAKQAIKQLRGTCSQSGRDAVRQLLLYFPDSPEAQAARSENLERRLSDQLDQHNSSELGYKAIDMLVRMTGSNRAFSYWFALVLLAVIMKALTFPFTVSMYRNQRVMQRLQPEIKALQAQYTDPAVRNEKIMAFYKERKVNPLASCLPLVVQLPVIGVIFSAVRLYEVHFSNGSFLWVGSSLGNKYPMYIGRNLSEFDFILLCIYALSNFISMRLTPSTDPSTAAQQRQMSVMFTVIMFVMFFQSRWSSAFILYWLIQNIISSFQQYYYVYRPRADEPALAAAPIAIAAASNGRGGTVSGATARPKQRKKKKSGR